MHEKEYVGNAQVGQAVSAGYAIDAGSRELTPKEILGREIEKRAQELRGLESLYRALPEEFVYPAQSVLRHIFAKAFGQ